MWMIGAVLAIALFCYTAFSAAGDHWGVFIDLSSIIFIGVGVLSVLLLSHGIHTWEAVIRCLWNNGKAPHMEDRAHAAEFMHTGSRAAIAFGMIGQLLGIMVMLMNMDDPEKIGPGMAMAFIALLYGIILSEVVFLPLYKRFGDNSTKATPPSISRTPLLLSLVVTGFIIASFWICMVSMDSYSHEQQYQNGMDSLKAAFGYDKNGVLQVPSSERYTPPDEQ